MAETRPLGRELTTSVADGDSFRYYPGFRDDAGELLEPQEPLACRYAIQLLCQQRLHGGLTIGDTHEADAPGLFETYDAPMDLIVAAARELIGDDLPRDRTSLERCVPPSGPVTGRDLLPARSRERRVRHYRSGWTRDDLGSQRSLRRAFHDRSN